MAAHVQQVNVASHDELESTIMSYIAQGFSVANRTADSATLFKKKEFNIIWAVVGFFLCLLPLLVYCIVYATQDDQMVMIKVTSATAGIGAGITWSEDRQWWWEGSSWHDSQVELPPGAVLSEDESQWWDGVQWRPVPARATEAQPSAPAPPPPPDA